MKLSYIQISQCDSMLILASLSCRIVNLGTVRRKDVQDWTYFGSQSLAVETEISLPKIC